MVRTLLFTVFLFGGVVVAAQVFEEPTRQFAAWMVDELGYGGILLGVFVADAFTFPIPPDTYLLSAVASDASAALILLCIITGSIAAGNVAYGIGPYVARLPLLRKRIERFRPQGEALFRRYGLWAVVLAAMTPLPFSISCWLAGIYHMKYSRFALATLARAPRFLIYYLVFVLGWQP